MAGHLIMLCGVPGCGKSTFAKQMIEENNEIILISRDKIRFELLNDSDKYFSKEKQVKQQYFSLLKSNLIKGKTVIADSTNLTPKVRQSLVHEIGLSQIPITAVFFDIPLEICLARNAERYGRERVPDKKISDMFYMQQPPNQIVERYINRIIVLDENFNIKGGT